MVKDLSSTIPITINATIADVWDALTNPEKIKKYFFGTNTKTDWKPGNPIRFTGEWQGSNYEDKGTVLDFKKHELIRYDFWSSISGIEDRPENYMVIGYRIEGSDGNVRLTVTQENIPNEQTKSNSEANWKKILNDLKNMLEHNDQYRHN